MNSNSNPNQIKGSKLPGSFHPVMSNPQLNKNQPGKSRARVARGIRVEDSEIANDDTWLRFRKNLHTLCGTALSFLIHAILLIALAFFVCVHKEKQRFSVVAEITAQPEPVIAKQNEEELFVEIETLSDDNSIAEAESTDQVLAEDETLPAITPAQNDGSADVVEPVENPMPLVPDQNAPIGGGLEGRTQRARSSLAARYGGTSQSELAVENGLKWLIDHQYTDGSWRLDFSKGPCSGRCKNPATRESTTAATGLSLMAFLGAGYTHKSGPYQQEIQAGLNYLKSRMRKSYFGGNLAEGTMYAQGIATIALSEAYAMTRDQELLATVKLAIEYIVTAQHSAGGWRYTPGQPGDTTVTGWQMMAIKSCQLADIEVPATTITKARKFLSVVGDDSSGFFGYQDKEKDATSTAIGLLLQIYMGWSREHRGLVEGTNYLVELGPSKNNIYLNYYTTQLLFHARHPKWESWNRQMRDYLIQTQSQTGHESGSWFFKERYGTVGGRLYTTAMAVMILEVYYRYLPLFDPETVGTRR